MLREAERNIQQIPNEECRERVREGIRSGDVEGRRDAEEIITKCMFEKYKPEDCRGITDPEECVRFASRGEFDRGEPDRGPGHGFDFSVCDNIDDIQSQLDCYRDNVRKSSLAGEYYDGRGESGGDYDYERFRAEHRDDYDDFARKDFEYREYEGSDFDSRYEEHQALIDATIAECESKQLPWFCNGPPSEPCYCGDGYDYGGGGYDDDGGFPPECAAVDCVQGYKCVSGGSCVPEDGGYSPPQERYEGEYEGEFEGGVTGEVVGGYITENHTRAKLMPL